MCILFLYLRRDLKGACKEGVRGTVTPRHCSARRRASPVFRTGDRDLKGACKENFTARPRLEWKMRQVDAEIEMLSSLKK